MIIAAIAIIHGSINELDATVTMVNQYNQNIDTALESAAGSIIEVSDGSLHYDKDAAVENFMNSLYASFGIIDDETEQNAFNVYVPVIAVADYDGFYVRFNYYEDSTVKSVWSVKYPYSYQESHFIVDYTLDDYVKVTDIYTGKVYDGDFSYLRTKYSVDPLYNPGGQWEAMFDLKCLGGCTLKSSDDYEEKHSVFKQYKDYAITHNIVEQMSYYANKNNEIAEAYGVSYTFALPDSAESELSRSINDITFIALFQGYPIGINTDNVYTRFAVAGARIMKSYGFHLATVNGVLYYHKHGCTLGDFNKNEIIEYRSKEECAELGALPCPYCKP